ncbi:NADH-quinone oxidoreductase subunit NuoG [Dokdonella koreensis]|uniref:NADH-quinone oxidoreductase subunit G n=1 Tax=Dokdonella koreensis DS-123 TaxID=1300342 RepID=A0A160DSU5_9GAMM|nr:NADH-quinone oxidoreductase subunit NuoG [Dokdonella koreensis]ANB17375.1 NADH-ubiquinone oxidoreductase chainG [Dokdonella koreensis DS-123]
MSAQPADPSLPPDHVSIEIDGQSMAVPKGSMIIAAADKAGIAIPRFCYHEKLPIAANCRMCMVEVEMGGRPMPKPQPACATPVADGMKIFTQSQRALSAQRNVMEFLLINHPLDCPICDQGGECELQDLSMGYGRSVSRFAERKRVVPDEDLGPLVQTEMTRCIQCTRCVRVMSEVAGTYELGGMERGERLQIGTYVGKPLMSELSGNVIDVCPVGALTNKPFRFRARAWELIARESIAYHDALGSNLWLHTRRGEVLRTVPRDNEAVNECWLSDRDRYGHEGLYAADRAKKPQVKRNGAWTEVEWDDALAVAAAALKRHAGDALGALVHPATSNEEGHLLAGLVRGLGSRSIDHRLRQLDLADGAAAVPFGRPFAQIEQADVVVLVGCNPRSELPLLNARLRKAARRGAKVHLIGSLDFEATYPLASKRIVSPAALTDALFDLAKAVNDAGHPPGEGALAQALAGRTADEAAVALARSLAEAHSAVVVVGETATIHPQASRLRAAARFIAAATGAACNEIPLGANAVGLAAHGVLPDADGLDARAMLASSRKAYLVYGIESPLDLADAAAWRTLAAAETVVAFSAYASETLKQVADVILPIGLLPEIDATLTNLDGVDQVVSPGAKLPGEARPGWRVLRALGATLGVAGFDFVDIADVRARLVPAAPRVTNGRLADAPASATVPGGLVRIATTAIYRGDAVLRRAPALNAHPLSRGPVFALHPEDALALGIGQGGSARVEGTILPVELTTQVPRGAVWVEAGYAETAGLPAHGAVLSIARV